MTENVNCTSKRCTKLGAQRVAHPNYLFLAGFLITVGVFLLGGYDFSESWKEVITIVTFIAFILACPVLYLILGLVLGLLSGVGQHEKYKKIEEDNANLKKDLVEKNKSISEKDAQINNSEVKINELNNSINAYQENIQSLNSQIHNLQNKIAVGWLKQAFKQHRMNSTERVTIYFEQKGQFSLLARYSTNPNYKTPNRQKFPINEGVISKAWAHGEKIENQCPVFETCDPTQYYDYMSKVYQFSMDDLKKFSMKSCWYVAVAITKTDDNIGVILFESIQKDILNDTEIKALISYCKEHESHLVHFIEESKALEVAKRMDVAGASNNTDNEILDSLGNGGNNE